MTIGMIILMLVTNAFVLAGVFLPIYAIFRYPVPDEPPVHRQIAQAVGADRETIFENPAFAPILSLCMQIAQRLNVASLRRKVRQDLNASGNPSGYSVDQYLALMLFSGLAVMLLGMLLDVLLVGAAGLLITIPVMAGLGFFVPMMVLSSQANRRVMRISKQLPYTLDLISLVMAAGSAFTESLETLIRDDPEEDLNQELQLALSEIEYGATRAQALRNLAERIPLESLRGVVGAVNQAESLGTPLASILKLQADMLRQHRGVRAEKLSASASLKILVPSMLIMMSVIVVICAPLVINFIVKGSIF